MVYITYEEYKAKYLDAQNDFDEILREKEELFSKTQPSSTDFSKEMVSKSIIPSDPFAIYAHKMQENKVDERLDAARSILDDRRRLLKLKEEELRQSKDWLDVIYTYYYIEKLSIRKIERRIPFSKSEIGRKLQIINKNIILGQKGKKVVVQ